LFGLEPGSPPSFEEWAARVHPADRDRVLHSMENLAAKARSGNRIDSHVDEYRIVRPDGAVVWLEATISVDSGDCVMMRGLVRDVTGSKRAQESLRESETRFRLALKNSPMLVTMQDADLVYRWAFNTRTRQPEEVVGRTDADLFAPDEAAALMAAKRQVLETGAEVRRAFWLTSNGQRVFLDCYYEPVRDAAGNVIGVGGASVNLTEQKRAEEALQKAAKELARSNEDLQQFAYVASHDLREPLRTISGFLKLLQERYAPQLDAKAREYIGYSVDGATRMSNLIRDLLEYSRAGRKTDELRPVDARQALAGALASLRTAVQEAGATVTHDELPTVHGDPTQLTQLFQNLVGNAIKFRHAERPCQVHVAAAEQQGGWVFSVRDNGIGIPPDQADRIFVIFQRLHTREQYAGTGIGLAICKKIVERHGGRISVESKPGEGSTFFFTLPEPPAAGMAGRGEG
jgi:PAS domain S-box-containing protein